MGFRYKASIIKKLSSIHPLILSEKDRRTGIRVEFITGFIYI